MSPSDPEYGVYERLAVLETRVDELMRMKIDSGKSGSLLGIPNPYIVYAILGLTAAGSGPQALELLAKVLLK